MTNLRGRTARPVRPRCRSRRRGAGRSLAAPGADAAHPAPLQRPARARFAGPAAAGGGVLGLVEIGFPAGLGAVAQGPRPARPARGAVSRHAVDRRGAGVSGLSRRRAGGSNGSASCAANSRTTARSKAFSTRRWTRRWRCRPASWRPRRWGSAPARSAFCATASPKSPRSSNCRTRCSRSPGCASATRQRRGSSACACRWRRPCISTATTIPGWPRRWTATTGGATRAIRSRTASATPTGSGSPSSTAGPRTRRARPRPRRAPASPAWLKAHGFTLDEP